MEKVYSERNNKRRNKLIITIICVILILLSMIFGIYAGFIINPYASGTITWDSLPLDCKVCGKITGNKGSSVDNWYSFIDISAGENAKRYWDLENISFKGAGEENAITIRLAIKNTSQTTKIYIPNIAVPQKSNNVNIFYQQAYGAESLLSYQMDTLWETSMQYLSGLENWSVDEKTEDYSKIALNSTANEKYLKILSRQNQETENATTTCSWFVLDITLVLIDDQIQTSQNIDFSIAMRSYETVDA